MYGLHSGGSTEGQADRDFACEKFLVGMHFFCCVHGLGWGRYISLSSSIVLVAWRAASGGGYVTIVFLESSRSLSVPSAASSHTQSLRSARRNSILLAPHALESESSLPSHSTLTATRSPPKQHPDLPRSGHRLASSCIPVYSTLGCADSSHPPANPHTHNHARFDPSSVSSTPRKAALESSA